MKKQIIVFITFLTIMLFCGVFFLLQEDKPGQQEDTKTATAATPVSQENTEASTEAVEYHTVSFLEYDDSLMTTIQVPHGEIISDIPTPQWEDGIFRSWTRVDTGELLTSYSIILEDVTYEPNWIYVPYLALNGAAVSEIDLNSLSDEDREELLNYLYSLSGESETN